MIDVEAAIARFTANAEVIAALIRTTTVEQARWRPAVDEWSVLEVIAHLADEEREDFRRRLDLTLHDPKAEWPPIDPEGWVTAHDYNARDPGEALDDFLAERQRSLAWLGSLERHDWSAAHDQPGLGTMTAEEILGAWLAHDLLHIRQLNQLCWLLLARDVPPTSLAYAGGW